MNKFLQKIFLAGTHGVTDRGLAQKMTILNKCLWLAMLIFIPNVILVASMGLPWSFIFDTAFWLLVVVALILNGSGRYKKARNITIISADLLLLCNTWAEGIASGNYLIYLPMIMLFSVLTKAKEEKKGIIVMLGFTLTCLLLCFVICPQTSYVQSLSPGEEISMYYANLVYSLVLTLLFTYIVTNVTFESEKENLRARMAAEESTRAKSMFLSNMSHELRTPLNGIIGTSSLLLQENYLPQQKEHLDVLKYSSEHMLILINDILDFNKIEAGKIGLQQLPVNIDRSLRQIESVFAKQFNQKGLQFIVEKDPGLDQLVLTDATRLTQVLNNLLGNALKFTKSGSVTLKAGVVDSTSGLLSVCFSVTDTGIGIAPEKLHQIFESFVQADAKTTRQYGGTGLGLSISKKIVEAFNSQITAVSEPGNGSSFSFTITFTRSKLQNPVIVEKKQPKFESLRGLKLLIAEDNSINMTVARKFLKNWDIDVSEAVNGEEAVTQSRNNTFDLLLLDLEMPVMDGHTALLEIRKSHPEIPAIAFTAAMYPDIKEQLLEKGFTDFVSKPFKPGELYQKIKQFHPAVLSG